MRTLQGIITALITPMRDGAVDLQALRCIVNHQVTAGIHGLVAAGTTGEAATLTPDDYAAVIRTTVETAAGRIPVLAGTGTNDTRSTIERTRLAATLGVDAALVVTPYYNKPQQEGLIAHYSAAAQQGGLPIVAYNVPGRTGVNLLPATAIRLSRISGVVGIKEASGSVAAVREIRSNSRPDFAVLSGDDGLALASFAMGACGVVSVASNVVPEFMVAMWDAWTAGRHQDAMLRDQRLAPLYSALFVETSPAPVKAAASLLGMCTAEVRLPLVAASAMTVDAVRQALDLLH